MEMDKTTQALLYLLRCGLHGTSPEEIPELCYDALFRLSAFHSVSAMTAMVLESGGLLAEPYMDTEQVKRWKETKAKAVRKNILLDEERTQILRYLDEQGIWYLPLKGCILKDLYPKLGMRQMSDNDILFDETYRHQLKVYMESRGYKTEEFAREYHDVYGKLPVYNFEFHVSLFDPYGFPDLAAHYADVKLRLKKDADNACGYHFSHEDFYIYILAHAHKHYIHGGTGIRSLMDIYVVLRTHSARMDWTYIGQELNALKLRDFEANVRNISMKLFGDEGLSALTQEEQTFLDYLIGSGVYGTKENLVKERLESLRSGDKPVSFRTRLYYVWRRLFPGRAIMKQNFPFCRKHEWSIPFFWICRLVRAVVFRRKNISAEYRAMKKVK